MFDDVRGPKVSALERTLGSCTISSESRPLSSSGSSSSRKLVLGSIPVVRLGGI